MQCYESFPHMNFLVCAPLANPSKDSQLCLPRLTTIVFLQYNYICLMAIRGAVCNLAIFEYALCYLFLILDIWVRSFHFQVPDFFSFDNYYCYRIHSFGEKAMRYGQIFCFRTNASPLSPEWFLVQVNQKLATITFYHHWFPESMRQAQSNEYFCQFNLIISLSFNFIPKLSTLFNLVFPSTFFRRLRSS